MMSDFAKWRNRERSKEKRLSETSLLKASRSAYEAWCQARDTDPDWGKTGFKAQKSEWEWVARSVLAAYHEAGYVVMHQSISAAMRKLADEIDEELSK